MVVVDKRVRTWNKVNFTLEDFQLYTKSSCLGIIYKTCACVVDKGAAKELLLTNYYITFTLNRKLEKSLLKILIKYLFKLYKLNVTFLFI